MAGANGAHLSIVQCSLYIAFTVRQSDSREGSVATITVHTKVKVLPDSHYEYSSCVFLRLRILVNRLPHVGPGKASLSFREMRDTLGPH